MLTDSISVGAFDANTSFNGAEGYNVNSTVSWHIENNGSWTIYNTFNSTGVTTHPLQSMKPNLLHTYIWWETLPLKGTGR
ncbi:MAG: hypothetical protein M0Z77_10610 [Thermoplasmatales archaeon]|nr:hypothetical protein [Thermoplasmatales archaeon]